MSCQRGQRQSPNSARSRPSARPYQRRRRSRAAKGKHARRYACCLGRRGRAGRGWDGEEERKRTSSVRANLRPFQASRFGFGGPDQRGDRVGPMMVRRRKSTFTFSRQSEERGASRVRGGLASAAVGGHPSPHPALLCPALPCAALRSGDVGVPNKLQEEVAMTPTRTGQCRSGLSWARWAPCLSRRGASTHPPSFLPTSTLHGEGRTCACACACLGQNSEVAVRHPVKGRVRGDAAEGNVGGSA